MLSLVDYDFEANMHLYRWKAFNILLDVNSGAIHMLDDISFELITNISNTNGDIVKACQITAEKFNPSDVKETLQEIEELYNTGAIFSKPEIPAVDLSLLNIKAICLNVAHACNMKCGYCFASQGDFGGTPSLMTLENAKQSIHFLVENSGTVKNLEVDFFGGEPLLVAPMLKELVSYCRSREKEWGKRFNFTLTTNSVLLDKEIMDWVIDNDISMILSLDGRKVTNDRNRVLNNGEGTYDIIIPHIKQMVELNPVSYFTRGTFTRDNLDFASDLEHMINLGFDCISLEPAIGADNPHAIQEEDLPRVLAEYEKLTDVLLDNYQKGRNIEFFHYNLNLQQGPCLAKRVTGCGAGIEYLVITPEGDIYPCHQFVGDRDFYMGNISTGIVDLNIRKKFENNQLKDKDCTGCWARYFCGGGCHANAYYISGDIRKPHRVSCTMHKKRIEGAIYLDLCKQMTKW